MEPDDITRAVEIAKAAAEVAKVAAPIVAPLAAAIPFTGIVKRMLGPAADELAEMWKDQVRLYRYERQLKCVEKAEWMAQEAGFTPQAVPPKILFPLLEGASFEENENLHTMWAALLANASMQRAIVIRPSHIAVLREMMPDEAEVMNILPSVQYALNQMGGKAETLSPTSDEPWMRLQKIRNKVKGKFHQLPGESELDRESRFATCLAALHKAGFTRGHQLAPWNDCQLTPVGYNFLQACRPPNPKK